MHSSKNLPFCSNVEWCDWRTIKLFAPFFWTFSRRYVFCRFLKLICSAHRFLCQFQFDLDLFPIGWNASSSFITISESHIVFSSRIVITQPKVHTIKPYIQNCQQTATTNSLSVVGRLSNTGSGWMYTPKNGKVD